MEKITKYKSTDGIEWHSEVECMRRDLLDARVRELENLVVLGEVQNSVVGNGERTKIKNPEVMPQVIEGFLKICNEQMPGFEKTFCVPALEYNAMGYSGRIISDYNIAPLTRLWGLIARTVGDFVYDQPYWYSNAESWE